jgi:hypothetical protein
MVAAIEALFGQAGDKVALADRYFRLTLGLTWRGEWNDDELAGVFVEHELNSTGSDRLSSGAVDLARAQSGCGRPGSSRAWRSGGAEPARAMTILERAARAAFEKVPPFDRLHAVQHRLAIDEGCVARRTEELRGWRLRVAGELCPPVCFHCLEDTMVAAETGQGLFGSEQSCGVKSFSM